jgi:putative oxidoreductase
MEAFGSARARDEVVLVARVLLVVLFAVSGWGKLTNYAGTVAYMTQIGAPVPSVATLVAIPVELLGALAIALGVWTRPIALVLALFTLGTALIGHAFWTMEGADRYANATNFYKNLSIIAAFLLLYVTGAGKYSLDARLGSARTSVGAAGTSPR